MADNFILEGARQNGSNKGVVLSATYVADDAQGRPILALDLSGTISGGALETKQDTQIVTEQAIQTLLGGTGALKDNGPGWTTANGIASTPFTSADASSLVVCTSAPTSGQKLVITDIEISSDTTLTLTFTCETSGAVVGKVYMAANSTVNLCTRSKRKLATADKKLAVQASGAGNISVNAFYYSEA